MTGNEVSKKEPGWVVGGFPDRNTWNQWAKVGWRRFPKAAGAWYSEGYSPKMARKLDSQGMFLPIRTHLSDFPIKSTIQEDREFLVTLLK